MKTISVAISPIQERDIEQLLLTRRFKNRSALVRKALQLLFAEDKMKPDALKESEWSVQEVRDRRDMYAFRATRRGMADGD